MKNTYLTPTTNSTYTNMYLSNKIVVLHSSKEFSICKTYHTCIKLKVNQGQINNNNNDQRLPCYAAVTTVIMQCQKHVEMSKIS